MKLNLIQYTENLYANYWLIPMCMAMGAMFCVFGIFYSNPLFANSSIFSIQYSESVNILSIIAASTATMLSVVLSITVLVLSLASNQLGPRLLPTFMKQGRTQLIIGFMLGTFVYALASMYLLSQFKLNPDTIGFYSSLGIFISIISFFLIIYFIHYVCHVIQIDNVLVYLGNDVAQTIARNLQPLTASTSKNRQKIPYDLEQIACTEVRSAKSGYIQILDKDKCKKFAKAHDVIIEILKRPGHYVFVGQPIFSIYHQHPLHDDLEKGLMETFIVGIRRTPVQDIEFAFEQISEIAIRALSPSITNPFTAINCLDRLAYSFIFLNQYAEEDPYIFDEDGRLRVKVNPQTMDGIINATFNRLRQQAQSDLAVSIRILHISKNILDLSIQKTIANPLYKQCQAILQSFDKKALANMDIKKLQQAFQEVEKSYQIGLMKKNA